MCACLAFETLELHRTAGHVAHIALHAPLEQVLDESFLLRAFEAAFELVKEDAAEFLHVVLLEGLGARPAEGLCQRLGLDRGLVRELHACKQGLELEADRVLLFVTVRLHRDVVHTVAELRRHVQALQQGVHVARRALVREPREMLGAAARDSADADIGPARVAAVLWGARERQLQFGGALVADEGGERHVLVLRRQQLLLSEGGHLLVLLLCVRMS